MSPDTLWKSQGAPERLRKDDMFICALCGREFPLFGNVLWCDDCIEKFLDGTESIDEFYKRKRSENGL